MVSMSLCAQADPPGIEAAAASACGHPEDGEPCQAAAKRKSF